MPDVKFTLRLDRDLLDGMAEQAHKNRRSVNQEINLLIIRYLHEIETQKEAGGSWGSETPSPPD